MNEVIGIKNYYHIMLTLKMVHCKFYGMNLCVQCRFRFKNPHPVVIKNKIFYITIICNNINSKFFISLPEKGIHQWFYKTFILLGSNNSGEIKFLLCNTRIFTVKNIFFADQPV